MANVSFDFDSYDKKSLSKSFVKNLEKLIKTIKKNGSMPNEDYYGDYKWASFYEENLWEDSEGKITIGDLFPDDVDSSVFELSPKKAAKKILKGDNRIHIDNYAAIDDFYLDAGDGDDIIEYENLSPESSATIKGGDGDDVLIGNVDEEDMPDDLDAYLEIAAHYEGGKGSDIFVNDDDAAMIIDDFDVNEDFLGMHNFNPSQGEKQKTYVRFREINGDLFIFDRKYMSLEYILVDVTDKSDVNFVNSDPLL